MYNEKSSKYVKEEMELYKYKAGDTIKQKISGKTYDSFTTSANNVVCT